MTMSMSLISSVGGGEHHLYLEVASATVALILAGRYAESRSKRRAGSALRALLEQGAAEATVVDAAGNERTVPIADLRVGDRFVVRPGERIATDGIVVEGAAAIDTSLVTGESVPRDVVVDDAVTGATIDTDGRLVVRATRVGADTTLAQMARLVEQARTEGAELHFTFQFRAHLATPDAQGWGGAAFEKMIRAAASRTLDRVARELPSSIRAALPTEPA